MRGAGHKFGSPILLLPVLLIIFLLKQSVVADLRVLPAQDMSDNKLSNGAQAAPEKFKTSGAKEQQASTTTTTSGVTLSPASISFGYQLVGTSSAQIVETVTNSGSAPLVITDISLSGRDHHDFIPTYSFNLPVTVPPGNSVAINLTFTPALPWRAGTRNARLEISEKKNSQHVALIGIGATCDGPLPSCSSGCADADDDGLNDAWEIAGGIDFNNDGRIDSVNDVLLPGADPNRPDIYLKYDYMVAPTHSHQPPARTWDQMKAMFAAHGIALHVVAPAVGIPEHKVTTLDPNAKLDCAGTDFITMRELRELYFGNLKPAYHYMVFAHDAMTPNDASLVQHCPGQPPCGARLLAGATGFADLPGNDSLVSFGFFTDSSLPIPIEFWVGAMMHELGHNLGLLHGSLADLELHGGDICHVNDINYKPNYISVMNYLYEFGDIVPATAPGSVTYNYCVTDADCGPPRITSGRCATPNSCFCTDDLADLGGNVCYRPDYGEDSFINLKENALNEALGVGGPGDLEDIVWYFAHDPRGNFVGTLPGASNGSPIDWNDDGLITDLTGVCAVCAPMMFCDNACPDLNNDGFNGEQMDTTPDWAQIDGRFVNLNLKFQCTQAFQNDSANPGSSRSSQLRTNQALPAGMIIEDSLDWALEHHTLHPPRPVAISVSPGCALPVKPVVAEQSAALTVALLGSPSFDVDQVETISLSFQAAKVLNVSILDVNGDGIDDLVAVFDAAATALHPNATVGRLTGWLKNGQAFFGEDEIRVVTTHESQPEECRNSRRL